MDSRQPIEQKAVLPPCQAACPAGVRARDYVALVAQGRFLESAELVREQMPLVAACGRVCRHPCETECNRGLADEPIAIMNLKRFVSDHEFRVRPPMPHPLTTWQQQRVAIVGAGPCGLAAAQDLLRQGYPVSLYESQEFPGGTVRIAIPRYKLPWDVLDWDIQRVLALGVKLQTRAGLGRDFTLQEIRQEGYDAVLLATGADRTRKRSRPEEGTFAEGDFAPRFVWTVDAVGAGHQAAQAIARFLAGEKPSPNGHRPAKRFQENINERVQEGHIRLQPRADMPYWQSSQPQPMAVTGMELGFTEETAMAEARRCLACGSAEVLPEKCVSCLTCLRVCPYEVPTITPDRLLTIREDRCQGCGICVGECPVRAIIYTMPGSEDLPRQMERLLQGAPHRPVVLGFFCAYNAIPSTHQAFLHSVPLPILPLTIPCLAKLDVTHFLKAFELGADAVLVVGCREGDCYVKGGALWGERRARTAQGVLQAMGLGGERIVLAQLLPSEPAQLDKELQALIEKLKALPPNPVRRL